MLSKYYSKSQLKEVNSALKEYQDPDDVIYEVLGLLESNSVPNKQTILKDLKNKKKNWELDYFGDIREQRDSRDQFIESPPEIKESDYPCPKCKTLKTIMLEIQTRSCDEGFTYELHCFNKDCGHVKRMG